MFTSLFSDPFYYVALSVSIVFFWSIIYLCSSLLYNRNKSVPSRTKVHPKGFGTAKYVLIIGCDGLGSYYLNSYCTSTTLPNINQFFTKGVHTDSHVIRTQYPSISAPNWSALLCGMSPVESGVLNNSWTVKDTDPKDLTVLQLPPISGKGKIPETLWSVAKLQRPSIKVGVSFSWDWINNLITEDERDTNDMMIFRGHENDSSCATALCSFIKKEKPQLMFIHFDSIDSTGHNSSWGSPEYYSAIQVIDGYIGAIMNTLSEEGILKDTLLILTSDHGGYEKDHDFFNQYCMFIPGLFLGPGVSKGKTLSTQYMSNKDFAPTALNALGLQPGKYMTGRILEEIYDE